MSRPAALRRITPGARSLSLSWDLRSPLQGRSYCAGRSLPDWLKEVRSLRGSVLFDNGRRRHFRTEEDRFFDADPIDLYAYHILAYDAMRLVGCVRVYSLVSNGFSCVTEQILCLAATTFALAVLDWLHLLNPCLIGSGANLKGSASGGNGLDDRTGLRTGTLQGSAFRPRDNCPVRAVVPDIQAQLP